MMKYTIFTFLLACFASIGVAQFDHSKFNDSSPLSMLFQPDEQLGDLFPAVQLYPVFNGSGVFVRCSPLSPPEEIVAAYEAVKNQSDFNLTAFVYQNFELPPNPPNVTTNTSVDVIEHIELLWPILTRQPEPQTILSSLIPLPNPYIVPGGHFQEVYYWDSFFTMLGLQKSGLTTLIRDIIDNFAFLINLLGHIPNGNRGYYMSRSQPPFFAMMLEILAQERGGQIWYTYGPVLRKEYDFWMDGADNLTEANNTYRRTVRMPDGTILNRYWDDKDTPRPEGYLDDVLLSRNTTRDPADLFRNIRAACESGWDFSSRWFVDPMNMTTIRTTHLIPVDLNSLMYHIELTLARVAKMEQDQETAKLFTQKANTRLAALNKYCWSEQDSFYYDYDFVLNQTTNIPTLAASYPLYFNMSTKSQASGVASRLQSEFSDIGGLLTTLTNSTQQWDAPNGWAPLQWMSIQGLKNYGYTEFANNITTNWTALNIGVYNKTGKLVEKYNVETIDLEGGGGQYPTQDGFGWTNGVLLALLSEEGYTIERIDA